MRCCLAVLLLLAGGATAQGDARSRVEEIRRFTAAGRLEKIREFLDDVDSEVRVEAARALFGFDESRSEAETVLLRELQSDDTHTSRRAALTLVRLGDPGVKLLVREMVAGRAIAAAADVLVERVELDVATLNRLRGRLVYVISRSKDVSELARCMMLASQSRPVSRACAAHALAHLRNGILARHVLALLDAAGPDKAFVASLREFINDEQIVFHDSGNGTTEYGAASSLLCRSGPEGVQAVIDRIGSIQGDRHMRHLRMGLRENLTAAFACVLNALRASNPLLRRRILPILAGVDDEEQLREAGSAVMTTMLTDRDAEVRETAAHWLPMIAKRTDWPHAERELRAAALGHAHEEVRSSAVVCLSDLGLASVEFLIGRLADESEDVRVAAVYFLGDHGPAAKSSIVHILKVLDRKVLDRGDNAYRCVQAIARIDPGVLVRMAPRDRRVIRELTRMLRDRADNVAGVAAWTLAEIGRPAERVSAAALRNLLETDDRESLSLPRSFALWRVTGMPEDLGSLVSRLRQLLPRFAEFEHRETVVQTLMRLGTDGASLVAVVEQTLKKGGLAGADREQLRRARDELRGAR